jgi:hypothetical protein
MQENILESSSYFKKKDIPFQTVFKKKEYWFLKLFLKKRTSRKTVLKRIK